MTRGLDLNTVVSRLEENNLRYGILALQDGIHILITQLGIHIIDLHQDRKVQPAV